jgi:hypothetical protein
MEAPTIIPASSNLTLFDSEVFTLIVQPGEVSEIRVPHFKGRIDGETVRGTLSGYFDDHVAFCKAVREIEGQNHDGAYFTLQVIDPRLIGRALNRMRPGIVTTSDNNVIAYRWLYIDCDPVRPSGISSSDSELQAACETREKVIEWIGKHLNFQRPIRAMSGNGYHALYRLPDLPVTDENKALVKGILEELARIFDNDVVSIDRTVFNPARICKLYGTKARKGDELPATPYREARPHRVSFIESLGGE